MPGNLIVPGMPSKGGTHRSKIFSLSRRGWKSSGMHENLGVITMLVVDQPALAEDNRLQGGQYRYGDRHSRRFWSEEINAYLFLYW